MARLRIDWNAVQRHLIQEHREAFPEAEEDLNFEEPRLLRLWCVVVGEVERQLRAESRQRTKRISRTHVLRA